MYEPLKDYEYEYEILNEEPYTIRHKNNKRLVNIRTTNDGYKVLTLNGKMKYLHKIIATHFIDNPNGYKELYFISGDKSDVSLSNLKWSSRKEINQKAKRIRKKTDKELKEMTEPVNLSRAQLRRYNKIHNINDVVEVKYSECDNKTFNDFIV